MRRLLLVVVTYMIVLSAAPASAKVPNPTASACSSLGVLHGARSAGVTDERIIGQFVAAAWRGFQPVSGSLPATAWQRFDKHLAVGGLERFCAAKHRVIYKRGVDSGRATGPGVLVGPCNVYRGDDGALFLHERSHTVTEQERAQVVSERQACEQVQRLPAPSSA